MIKEALIKIVNKEDLTYDEAFAVMTEIMTGQTSATQNAAFLAALTTKSSKAETISEIVGCAAAMRAQAISVPNELDLIDIVGTGGDGSNSFNISTTAALICTAGGVKVAKHGNRAASSKCGTADCLQTLGVNIELTPEQALEALEQDGFCFFFAQKYHPAMKYVGAIRKELGFRTVFNILGPLTNPARPKRQLLGVYDESLVELLAHVLQDLGVERGMVVYGQNRMDEISLCAPTTVVEFDSSHIYRYEITPEQFSLLRCHPSDLLGGTPEQNAQIVRDILSGRLHGAKRDAAVINAAAGLYIAGKADSLRDGLTLANQIIDSGQAETTLNKLTQNRG